MSEERPMGLVIDVEARITKLEQGLKRASDRQKKAAAEMERRAQQSAQKIGDAYSRVGDGAARGFGALGAAFQANSYKISGVATQVGDLMTQIGGGTSALRAFGSQAAQIGGYLGPVGIFAGTAAAALIPLAASLLKTGDEAGNLEDQLKALADSTGNMESAVASAAVPVEELRLKWRDLADEIQRANGIAAGFASAIAQRDALTAAKGLGNGLTIPTPGDNLPKQWDGSVNLDRARIAADTQRDAMAKLAETTGATGDQLDRLKMALNRVESVNSLDAVVRDSENLLSLIKEFYATADETQRQYLEAWAKNISAVMDSAKRQIEAQRAEDARLVAEYDQNTSKMNALTADRQRAEELLTKAKTAGDAEQVASMQRVIDGIDQQIRKMQELARQSSETYKQIQSDIKATAAQILASGFEYITGSTPQQFATDATAGEKGILSLIGQKESGGNYNATLDNGKYTGGARNLVNMTIDEVLEMQAQMLRHPDNHHNSSAAGKYQIVGKTLRGLKSSLGLTGNELYSPEMQDRLATELLRKRIAQPGDTVENLRAEWTSLKSVNPAIINDALGRQSIDRTDPEVAKRAADAKDAEAKARERNAKAASKEAEAQNKSTVAADAAAEAARKALEAQTEGAEALVSLFEGATQGAEGLAAALKNIALQIVKTQIMALAQNSPASGWLGRLLGAGGGDALTRALAGAGAFSEGGFTGPGGKHQVAGLVHRGEFVLSKAAVARIGVPALEALHQSALKGYSGGGLVGDTGQARKAVSGSLRRTAGAPQIIMSPTININATGGTPEANADLARQVSAQTERAMRGLIQDELVRQMRPGNVLGRR